MDQKAKEAKTKDATSAFSTVPSVISQPEFPGVPTQQELDAQTLQDDAEARLPSEMTEEELSDITQEGYKQFIRRETTTRFGSSFSPVIVNPYLRRLAVVNAFSWVIAIGFCAFVLFEVVTIWYRHADVRRHSELDLPCMFDWLEWGPCSASCRSGSEFPVQERYVDTKSIVHSRGIYAERAPCPTDLETLSDKRSCNVHQCPKLLSSFEFRKECIEFDGKNVEVRDLTIDDMETVTIDTFDLYRPCSLE